MRSEDSIRVVDLAWLEKPPSGTVRYCTGEDVSGSLDQSVNEFRKTYQGQATADLDPRKALANDQRQEYLRMFKAASQNECDVVQLDVAYMPEFAQKNLLYNLTPYLKSVDGDSKFDKNMMRTVRHGGRSWGVPKQLDVAMLFYRKDLVSPRPRTWDEVREKAQKPGELPGLRFQSADYEGLTVVFLELAYAAGAQDIITGDGKLANIDQEPAIEAANFMRGLIGPAVPPGSIGEIEKGAVYAFEHGRASLVRSWPFTYERIKRDAQEVGASTTLRRAASRLGVMPLPRWTERYGRNVGILGGQDLVIPRNAANPRGALSLINFLTNDDQVGKDADRSLFPVINSLQRSAQYARQPWFRAIRRTDVRVRPLLTNYADISEVISSGLSSVLSGKVQAREALISIDRKVQTMLDKS